MSSFTSKSANWYARLSGIDYVVLEGFTWDVGFLGSGDTVEIEYGYIFNCSIPKAARWVFNPHDPAFLRASAVHDKLLDLGMDRPRAGAEFLAALKADKVPKWKRFIMWLAVSAVDFE